MSSTVSKGVSKGQEEYNYLGQPMFGIPVIRNSDHSPEVWLQAMHVNSHMLHEGRACVLTDPHGWEAWGRHPFSGFPNLIWRHTPHVEF